MRFPLHVSAASVLLGATLACTAPLHAADKESRAAGEATYHSAGCERCHGTDWSGTDRAPDLRGVGKRLKREEISRQVHDGGGGMPAYGDVLTDPQLAQLVDFLEAQKKAPPKPKKGKEPAPVTPAKPADPE